MKKELQERIILGVDPGTRLMGYGIICVVNQKLTALDYGVLHLGKKDGQFLKLKQIFEQMTGIIEKYHPDEMALESPFYSKNIQVALKLGRAQGVAMASALVRQIPITEYAPRKVKQSVTGNGNASKEQVASMLKTLLKIEEKDIIADATDALGVAVCHFFQGKNTEKKISGWNTFIRDNPNRIK